MPKPFVVGDSSPFLKRVLVPFWVIRLLIMFILVVVYGLIIAGLAVFKDEAKKLQQQYNTSLAYGAVMAVSVIALLIILACMALDIACIVMRIRRTLTPRFFLIANCIQTFFFFINFIFALIGPRTVAAIVINVFILLSFLGLLVYAGIVFHQFRTGKLAGAYVPAHNPEVHNLVPGEGNTAYPPQVAVPAPYSTEYKADQASFYNYGQQQYAGPQVYEPYAHQYPAAPSPAPVGAPGQPPQQGYEMQPRQVV